MLDTYCIRCHNQRLLTGGLALDSPDVTTPHADSRLWERVIAKLRAGSMPPPGLPRPDKATYQAVASRLEADLDRAWAADPRPGRTNAVHRLNRTEYRNAIHDLFALDVDVRSAAAGRRDSRRKLRQRRGCPHDFEDPTWNDTCQWLVR